MKKFKITAEEYDFIWSKIQSLEAENNRLKGYIEGLKEQLCTQCCRTKEQLICDRCKEQDKEVPTDPYCMECKIEIEQQAN